ncbi:MAG: prefoldin subunit beta [Candidatus Woesearchaeota archaeon]|nr:MAG: prefoldin subunit beta [Candidatus Woesearchaeota archaeon]
MADLDKKAQEELAQLQLIQQQLQILVSQKQVLQQRSNEIEDTLKELDKAKEPVYKLVGEALIQKDKKEIITDLKKEKDKMEIRLKSVETQENKIRDKAKELQEKVTKELKK